MSSCDDFHFFFFLNWSQGYQLAPINEEDLLEAIEERAEDEVWFSLSREELIYSENTEGLPDSLKAPRVARHRVVWHGSHGCELSSSHVNCSDISEV